MNEPVITTFRNGWHFHTQLEPVSCCGGRRRYRVTCDGGHDLGKEPPACAVREPHGKYSGETKVGTARPVKLASWPVARTSTANRLMPVSRPRQRPQSSPPAARLLATGRPLLVPRQRGAPVAQLSVPARV